MSVGGLYRHFKDKHQIFVELIHRGLEANRLFQDELARGMARAVGSGDVDLRRALDGLVEMAWGQHRAVPVRLLHTLEAMRHEDEAIAELCEQYDRYERAAIAGMLARISSRDWIPSPLAAAKVLDIAYAALAQWAVLHPGPDSRGVKKAAADMLYRYLVEPGSRSAP